MVSKDVCINESNGHVHGGLLLSTSLLLHVADAIEQCDMHSLASYCRLHAFSGLTASGKSEEEFTGVIRIVFWIRIRIVVLAGSDVAFA